MLVIHAGGVSDSESRDQDLTRPGGTHQHSLTDRHKADMRNSFSTRPFVLPQVLYTLDVSVYVSGAPTSEKGNFYHCINKAMQKREPVLLAKLSGLVTRVIQN